MMHRTIVVFEGADGFYWRRVGGNGRKMYTSGESFASRSNAVRAARDHASELETPVRVVEEKGGEWVDL